MRKAPGPEPSPEVLRALQPFVGVSALASTALIALVGALFLVPLAYAQQQGWTGAGAPVGPGLAVLAVPALVVIYAASKQGIRRQLRPLAQVASALHERLGVADAAVHGRLRRGWGLSYELPLPDGPLRVVAARGQQVRPDLYLVRGEREHRFRAVREPLPELDEALRAVGL